MIYKQRAALVEAEQLGEDSWTKIKTLAHPWAVTAAYLDAEGAPSREQSTMTLSAVVYAQHGRQIVRHGDWVVKLITGELHVLSDAAFKLMFAESSNTHTCVCHG